MRRRRQAVKLNVSAAEGSQCMKWFEGGRRKSELGESPGTSILMFIIVFYVVPGSLD